VKSVPGDRALVERLQKGDVEAFDLLYHRYSGKLYAFGLKYRRSKAEAEEIVQSVFLKLWENREDLDKETSFKSYLFTIAYNDLCKIFRKSYIQQQFIDKTLQENPQSSIEAEEGIDYVFFLERVQKIVGKLPEKQRTIFLKSRQEGKSTKEIAEEVGLSPGTVDNYMSEALKFIRVRLFDESLPVLMIFLLFL